MPCASQGVCFVPKIGTRVHSDVPAVPKNRNEGCDPSIPPEEFLGPSGPKLEMELKMSSRGLPALGSKKAKNGVEKESKKLKKS